MGARRARAQHAAWPRWSSANLGLVTMTLKLALHHQLCGTVSLRPRGSGSSSPTKDPLKFCCRMCGLEDTAKKGGHCITVGLSRDALSTSNLIDHIRRAHSALAARIDEARDAEDLLDKALADKILQQLGDKATSRKLDAWVSRSALTTAETTDVVVAL